MQDKINNIQSKIKNILEFYGHKFMSGKTILDLGCGEADISGVFRQLGADVIGVDARQEHLNIASKKFPGLKTFRADLDRIWLFQNKKFDLILSIDLLNYLSSYEDHIKLICSSTDHLILEAAVVDFEDIITVTLKNSFSSNDGSMNGIQSYPSSKAIEKILSSCQMSFKRMDDFNFNVNSIQYDWISKNSGSLNKNQRRIWFCTKNNKIGKFQLSNSTVVNSPKIELKTSNTVIAKPEVKIETSNIELNPKPKIKLALCISGHLRTFEENYSSVKKFILDKNDCDVFIHTWNTIGHKHRNLDSNLSNTLTNNLLDKITKIYNPKKIVMEKERFFPPTKIMIKRMEKGRDIVGVQSMYYKIESCNLLKKQYENQNGFVYDCVMRFRGDLRIENSLPLNFGQNFDYLYLPTVGNFGGLNDQIAFGSSQIMDKYSTLFSNIDTYLEEGCIMNPEKLLEWHLNKIQLKVNKTDIKYVIVRSNGEIQDNYALEKSMGFSR
jgi:SAM-dependent methyltransferase